MKLIKLINYLLYRNGQIHYHLFRQLSNKNLHVLFSMFYQQNTHTGLWWFRWYAHIPSDWSRLLQAPIHLKELIGLPIYNLIIFFNIMSFYLQTILSRAFLTLQSWVGFIQASWTGSSQSLSVPLIETQVKQFNPNCSNRCRIPRFRAPSITHNDTDLKL